MRESKIEAYLRQRVTEAGGLCWKFTSPGLRGVPDRIVVMPDTNMTPTFSAMKARARTYWIEVKAPGEMLRPDQERRHEDLRARGAEVYVIDSIEAVDYFMLVIS